MMASNFLNHCVIHQDLVEHVDDQKRFQEYSYSLSRSKKILSLQYVPIVLVIFVLDLSIDSLFVIPDHAA